MRFRTLDLTKSANFAEPPFRQLRALLESWKITVYGKPITVDTNSGDLTRRALYAFQHNTGLKPDMIAGEKTWAMLCLPLEV